MKNDFFILGHGGSGTSLLRGLLNAHNEIDCGFEAWAVKNKDIDGNLAKWAQIAKEHDKIWGNKIPLEMFWSNHWPDEKITEIGKSFLVLWIVRRYPKWIKKQESRKAEQNWIKGRAIYWAIRNGRPDAVIEVSFEDLLLRTESELRRICDFLHIGYEQQMLLNGLNNTGHAKFNYGKILTEKV